jgi:hypothetical protein
MPLKKGLNPKRRLRDTIARLNREQIVYLLRFHSDGTGRAVDWELTADTAIGSPSDRQQRIC